MSTPRTEILKKGDLEITIVYTGKELSLGYIVDDSDGDYSDDDLIEVYGPEVEDIIIKKGTHEIRLFHLFPNKVKDYCRFVGPVDSGDGYKEQEKIVTFGDLHMDGSILGILHEIGHVWVNERYHQDGSPDFRKKMAKYERHAWGYALSLFNQFKRDGLNLEPNFDAQGVKKFIKESLLSHEISHRYEDYSSNEGRVKNKNMEFWTGLVAEDEIDAMVEKFFPNEDVNSEATRIIRESFRK